MSNKKTVNFIEAVNSGRRFRRVGIRRWRYFTECELQFADRDFFSAQFELEEKSVTITDSEFDEAWEKAKMYDTQNGIDKLKQALGL